jgi:hypothetical protein
MLEGDAGPVDGEGEADGDDVEGPGTDEEEQNGVGVTDQRTGGTRPGGLCGLGSVLLLIICAPLLVAWKVCRRR